MNKAVKYSLVAGFGFAILALCIAPRPIAQAQAPPKPAITSSIDDPGRSPYQEQKTVSCTTPPVCTVTFTPVVPNRAVIQRITGIVNLSSTPTANLALITLDSLNIDTTKPARTQSWYTHSLPLANTNGLPITLFTFDNPVLAYFGAGLQFTTPMVSITSLNSNTISNVTVTISGYYVDCLAALCGNPKP
jgi:hypothetical protein